MVRLKAKIVINREISPSWNFLGFSWPPILQPPLPGQFFTFLPRGLEYGESALLRRPLAFAGFENSIAYCIFQAKGPGTKALARLQADDSFDTIAPLGKPFPLPSLGEIPMLAGGGIGIGPMLFLASSLRMDTIRQTLHLGFRTSSQIPSIPLDTLSLELSKAQIATDDGSRGFKGTVTQAMETELTVERGAVHLFACGPQPMLASIARLAATLGIPAHVSVEQWMACGVGACHGCVVPTSRGGYLRACTDGPVFDSRELSWEG